jgi:hypothetical protein
MSARSRARVGLHLLWPIAVMALANSASSAARKPSLANPLQAQPLGKLLATNARPLFVPSRHQPAPEPRQHIVQAPAPPRPPPHVALVGVLKSETGVQALLRLSATGKLVSVRMGNEVEGWKISDIDDRRLRLTHDGQETTVLLFKASGGSHIPKTAMPVSYQPPEPSQPDTKAPPPAAKPLIHLPSHAQSGRW